MLDGLVGSREALWIYVIFTILQSFMKGLIYICVFHNLASEFTANLSLSFQCIVFTVFSMRFFLAFTPYWQPHSSPIFANLSNRDGFAQFFLCLFKHILPQLFVCPVFSCVFFWAMPAFWHTGLFQSVETLLFSGSSSWDLCLGFRRTNLRICSDFPNLVAFQAYEWLNGVSECACLWCLQTRWGILCKIPTPSAFDKPSFGRLLLSTWFAIL